jgi:hypothetical protein
VAKRKNLADHLRLPIVDKETFLEASDHVQHAIMYEMLVVALKNQSDVYSEVQSIKKLNMAISAIFGTIGGAAAVLGKWIIGGH